MEKEIMYSINFKTYVEVYKIFENFEALFRNPQTHTWETSSIWSLIPKTEWEEFLEFYEKWVEISDINYKEPKIHIGTKKTGKDKNKEVYFVTSEGREGTSEYNIYNSYKEAEEVKKIYIFEDYYSFLTRENKEEMFRNV